MSFLRGLVAGLLITALQIAGAHAALEYERYSFHGSHALSIGVPVVLLPLAIAWGWTWVSDRWSGRSGPRLLLFTLALALGAAVAFPLDHALFPPADGASLAMLVDLALVGALFVLPVISLAALLYWAFASGKVPASFGTLAVGYLGGLLLAVVLPTLTMGAVAGTAAGHSWQKPGARTAVSVLVVMVMLVGMALVPVARLAPLP